MCIFGYRALGGGFERDYVKPAFSDITGKQYLDSIIQKNKTLTLTACQVVYRSEFLQKNKLKFAEDHIVSEDFDFNMRCLLAACSVSSVGIIIYNYRVVKSSLSHAMSTEKILVNLKCKAKWFRLMPCASIANMYADNTVLVDLFGRGESAQCVKFIKENMDIMGGVSQPPLKLARRLFKCFGPHAGAKIYQSLLKLKNKAVGRHWR